LKLLNPFSRFNPAALPIGIWTTASSNVPPVTVIQT
jgi:hypothetical protein